MIPGFHVGGLLLHDQADAIIEVARIGYRCVAIKPRRCMLDPADQRFSQQLLRTADAARRADVQVVIDTDALFMPQASVQRGPSLAALSDSESSQARQWIETWIDVAAEIGSPLITFSSGKSDVASDTAEDLLERIAQQLTQLAQQASRKNVHLALRPRSSDAISTVAQFERLGQWLEEPGQIQLAADIGEMLLGHEIPLSDRLIRNLDVLACVYLSDHTAGVVGDQRIGHGDVAVSRILASLAGQPFAGPVIARFDGHCELGYLTAEESWPLFEEVI